jgi:hypothetical protein
MLHTLFQPDYTLIINPRLKYIHLTINRKGELIVKAPRNSQHQISQLLHTKKDWIEKAQRKFMQKKGKLPTFKTSENELYYLGDAYPLQLSQQSNIKSTHLEYSHDFKFNLCYKEFNLEEFYKQIDKFYKEKAKELIPPLVEKQAKIMSLYPTAINFRKTKRQWGSCSAKNRLSFHIGLIKLPLDVIQYVIIHELSHIKHKHHQKAFWQEVERYSPHYKKLEHQLKEYLT